MMLSELNVNCKDVKGEAMSILKKCKGRITKVDKDSMSEITLIQGVKAEKQSFVESRPNIKGSNGSYIEYSDYLGTFLNISLFIYEPPDFQFDGKYYQVPEYVEIECYQRVLDALGKKRISKKAYSDVKSIEGKKTELNFVTRRELLDQQDDSLAVIIGLPYEINGMFPFRGVVRARSLQL